MKKLNTVVSIGVALVLVAVTVVAAPPREGRGHRPPRDMDKAIEHFEMLSMLRMMEALDLDKATAEKIFDIRHKFTAQQKALIKELGKNMEALKERLQQESLQTDDKELSRIIKAIRDKRKALQELRDKQYDELSQVLTMVQQAQLLIFTKDFQDEIRAFVHRPMLPPPGFPPPPPAPGAAASPDPFGGPVDF